MPDTGASAPNLAEDLTAAPDLDCIEDPVDEGIVDGIAERAAHGTDDPGGGPTAPKRNVEPLGMRGQGEVPLTTQRAHGP